VYDWLILLDLEVEHVWKSEWTIPKTLFIISRYGPFLDMPITITGGSSSTLVHHWNERTLTGILSFVVHTVPNDVIDYEVDATLLS